jgi:hypothetical protein
LVISGKRDPIQDDLRPYRRLHPSPGSGHREILSFRVENILFSNRSVGYDGAGLLCDRRPGKTISFCLRSVSGSLIGDPPERAGQRVITLDSEEENNEEKHET